VVNPRKDDANTPDTDVYDIEAGDIKVDGNRPDSPASHHVQAYRAAPAGAALASSSIPLPDCLDEHRNVRYIMHIGHLRGHMNNISYNMATDQEILRGVGERLGALRTARGLTQSEAAERAGLSRNTLYHAERGDNPTLLTVIRLLRVYGRVSALESFLPPPEISPMARLKARKEMGG
jgi:DNA-binding XRE family transcriptional regulator